MLDVDRVVCRIDLTVLEIEWHLSEDRWICDHRLGIEPHLLAVNLAFGIKNLLNMI